MQQTIEPNIRNNKKNQELLKEKANPNTLGAAPRLVGGSPVYSVFRSERATALHFAVRVDPSYVELLIAAQADVTAVDSTLERKIILILIKRISGADRSCNALYSMLTKTSLEC